MQLTAQEAKEKGYAKFNGGPHLCVDIPDGHYTITTRLSNGKRVTFAFCPYEENKPARCVDIQMHDTEEYIKNGDAKCPVQEVIVFTVGTDCYRSKGQEKKPTLTTLILGKSHES